MKPLRNSRYVLALDPSGSYKEGMGTTGWCLYDIEKQKIAKFGFIDANKYSCQFQYWDAHLTLIDSLEGYHPDLAVEDYLLYGARAEAQINSRLETPQLLGILKYEVWKRGSYIHLQTAAQVKTRWSNNILLNKGLIEKDGLGYKINGVKVSDHILDSVRHALHYAMYTSNFRRNNDRRNYDNRFNK
jgi:hypothetical protein